MINSKYILVSVAYNEQELIHHVILSVINQTVLPMKWLIVSDGSTDNTDQIIQKYSKQYDFIEYARQEKVKEYAGRLEKVTIAQSRAMKLAMEKYKTLEYDFLGNLDADVTLEPEYYEKVLKKFEEDSELGLAGGGAYNVSFDGVVHQDGFIKPDFVGGPIQMFRRKCIEQFGGYPPYGHSDCVAVMSLKMRGWKVRCFPEIKAFHHDMPGNSIQEKVPICFRMGQMDYIMGGLFIFELGRSIIRMLRKPYLFAGGAMLAGFCWAAIVKKPLQIPSEISDYLQIEQRIKMKMVLKSFNNLIKIPNLFR
jgi:glycosyltransferase involved in cell wall biosynthesis